MFRLVAAKEPRQRLEIIPTGGKEVAATLTNLLDQSVDEHELSAWTAHPSSSSSHSISAVTTGRAWIRRLRPG